jgi:hypothetical protein
VSNDDRRLLDLEWREEVRRRFDRMEELFGGVAERLEKVEEHVDANATQIDLCVKAINKLAHETEGTRRLWRDSAGALRLIRALWKPLILAILVVNVLWAAAQRVLFGAWPPWYLELLRLLK